MNPILLKLGPIQVHWYGVLIVLGAIIAAWICTKEAARRGEDPDHVWNLLTWALIFGIIGARLYHVFSTPTGNFAGWAYYREHPLEIVAFWNGGFRGLGIYGAVIGGVLAYYSLADTQQYLPFVLAIAASSFIYIAVADLIPGLHRRLDIRGSLQQITLIGAGVALIFLAHSTLH
jgi:prolipoprotein diacylglyceryltransferase